MSDWVAWTVLLPLIGAMGAVLWARQARWLGLLTVVLNVSMLLGLSWQVMQQGVLYYPIGGWSAPLGIELAVDGLSLLMLWLTALVAAAVSLHQAGQPQGSSATGFWPLWLLMLAGLNGLFVAADLFNLYVTLELLGLSAVALVALAGTTAALQGAMRYLLVSLFASLCYLLGVALLYHSYGTVDIGLLAERMTAGPASYAAMGLMVAAMVLKTALVPFHFWLPSAHASAPSAVSAVLSALVVKASFYLLMRLWLEVFAPLTLGLGWILGGLGAVAIVWGSIQALRQVRLKLLVAYSTVAQLGYLFLPFALLSPMSWQGGVYFALSHGLAKAAMFLAAGNILAFGGHDRIVDLDRVAQRLPLSMAAFCLAGVSLMGLPPSGGFIAKWLMLETAIVAEQWLLVAVMLLGGVLAAGYVFKVIGYAFTPATIPQDTKSVPWPMEWAALGLAVGAIVLGFVAMPLLAMLEQGGPLAGGQGW